MTWISVNDRLPENGDDVLIAWKDHLTETIESERASFFDEGGFQILVARQEYDWNHEWESIEPQDRVLYWILMPEAPKL